MIVSQVAQADHLDKHITIEVSVKDTNPYWRYNICVGIPDVPDCDRIPDNLYNSEKRIYGSDFEIYTYNFDFYDIELNTPFEACVEIGYHMGYESGPPEELQGNIACKSYLTNTDNGHIPIELSVKDAVKEFP
jgi:hypothetical protein